MADEITDYKRVSLYLQSIYPMVSRPCIISRELGISLASSQKVCQRLCRKGKIRKLRRGIYQYIYYGNAIYNQDELREELKDLFAKELKLSEKQQAIILFSKADEYISPDLLSSLLNISRSNAQKICLRLFDEGILTRIKRGQYILSESYPKIEEVGQLRLRSSRRRAWDKTEYRECEVCDFYLQICPNIIHKHHIIPRSKGGAHTINNQFFCCPTCHALIHQIIDLLLAKGHDNPYYYAIDIAKEILNQNSIKVGTRVGISPTPTSRLEAVNAT